MKSKNMTTLKTVNSTPNYMPEINECISSPKDIHKNIHRAYNTPKN